MATVNSIRQFHNELDTVCSSLEALFRLVGGVYPEIDAAVHPALHRFRYLLDEGDELAGDELAMRSIE